jgi:hypothetical protein
VAFSLLNILYSRKRGCAADNRAQLALVLHEAILKLLKTARSSRSQYLEFASFLLENRGARQSERIIARGSAHEYISYFFID